MVVVADGWWWWLVGVSVTRRPQKREKKRKKSLAGVWDLSGGVRFSLTKDKRLESIAETWMRGIVESQNL